MQSSCQQQSLWPQVSDVFVWKQGEFPSADWMALISSVFCILPVVIPIAVAIFLISCIFIEFPPFVYGMRMKQLNKAMNLSH
jgi:hypothetical protein